MSATDYVIFIGLLVSVLATQLGRHQPGVRRLFLPLVLVVAIGAKYLKALPSGGADRLLELGGLTVGAALGFAVVGLMKVQKDPDNGRLVTVAGWTYGLVWTVAIAGRFVFAFGATHWFSGALGSFSRLHHVASVTYGAAFVLMALAMTAVRTFAVMARSRRLDIKIDFTEPTFGHRRTSRAN